MALNLLVGDFETFFCTKTGYTLKKMTTEEYIRDPRFKAHGVSFRNWTTGQITWVTASKLPYFFSKIDWANTAFLAHHNNFDAFILSHHYGVHPAMLLCTLNMANLMIPHRRKSLDEISKFMNLPAKFVPYNLFDGIRDLPPDIERQVADGCNHDVWLNHKIYERFITGDPALDLPAFPPSELEAISITCQMFTQPSLTIDIERAEALSGRMIARKAATLRTLARQFPQYFKGHLDNHPDEVILKEWGKVLRSRNNFPVILKDLGVEPPMKQAGGKNAKPGDLTYAFAKSDAGMKELLESENEAVVALCEAKLDLASTTSQTRAATFAGIARRGQPVPVYLKYAATFSHRTGGAEKTNWSNLERLPNKVDGEFEKGADGHPRKGEIRLCVTAPPGYVIVIVDLSQIEARMLATNAGQWDLVEKFRDPRADPYSDFIGPYYGYPISKATPSERGVGKQLVLSCGYMAGGMTIKTTAALGSYGPAVELTLAEAEKLKTYYRTTNYAIPQYWKQLDEMLPLLVQGGRHTLGPLRIADHRIWLPNDSPLDYTTLHAAPADPDDPEWKKAKPNWKMRTMGGVTRVHKGIVTAHVTSSLSQLVLADAMKVIKRAGYRVAMTCYDEVVMVVPESQKEKALAVAEAAMSVPPWWLPQLPVACEGHWSRVYDK